MESIQTLGPRPTRQQLELMDETITFVLTTAYKKVEGPR